MGDDVHCASSPSATGRRVAVTRVVSLALALLIVTAFAAAATDLTAATQRLVVDSPVLDVEPGGFATLTFLYDAADATLPGVAFRVHYDSSKLTVDGSELLYAPGILGHQDQPDAGSAYADQYDDGDPTTDHRYLAAWSDFRGAWPGEGTARPLPLLRLRFRVSAAATSTDLRFTGNACNGCILELPSVRIQVAGGGLTTTSAPSPTTTPTPGPDDTPIGDAPSGPYGSGSAVRGIPTLSDLGAILLGAALAASAVILLLRRRG